MAEEVKEPEMGLKSGHPRIKERQTARLQQVLSNADSLPGNISKIMQWDLHDPDNDADGTLSPVEVTSLLYFLFLKIKCDQNVEMFKFFQNTFRTFIHKTAQETFRDFKIENISCYAVGSHCEGIADFYGSDIDILLSLKDEICYDGNITLDSNFKTVFKADKKYAKPGYTLLVNTNTLQDSSKENRSFPEFRTYEDNSRFIQSFSCVYQRFSVCGPAVHFNLFEMLENLNLTYVQGLSLFLVNNYAGGIFPLNDEYLKSMCAETEESFKKITALGCDLVAAIPFISKSIEESWVNRKRMYDWPSKEIIEEMSKLHGHVVPVGMKGSIFEQYEWRISYTLLENKLICSLNEVQLHLFVVLKIYAKHCECVSSYMVKNLVLWMAECLPQHYFQEIHLIPLIRSSLVVLQKCVEKKCLPNYIIPARNLFAGKFDDDKQRQDLIDFLLCNSSVSDPLPVSNPKLQDLFRSIHSKRTAEVVEGHKHNIRSKILFIKQIMTFIQRLNSYAPMMKYVLYNLLYSRKSANPLFVKLCQDRKIMQFAFKNIKMYISRYIKNCYRKVVDRAI